LNSNFTPVVTLLASVTFGMGSVAAQDARAPVAKKVAEFRENEAFVVGGLDFSGDGSQLATNGMVAGPEVHIWNWRTPSQIVRVLPMNSSAGVGDAIHYSPGGSLLAVGHVLDRQQVGSGLVRIWNTKTWAIVRDIAEPQGASDQMGFAFAPDGKVFVRTVESLSSSNLVVHRTDTWDQTWGLVTRPFLPRTLTLSPDGQFAAMAGWRATQAPQGPLVIIHPEIIIVDLATRRITRAIAAFPDYNEIHALSWSPDGKALAAGAVVGGSHAGPDAVKIFDPATGAQLVGEVAKDAFVSGLSYSRDGRYLIEGHIDGNVRIWDGQHKQMLQTIPVDKRFYTKLSITPDSRFVAIAAGPDVSVWELQ
jgi:WD40 repeat protein